MSFKKHPPKAQRRARKVCSVLKKLITIMDCIGGAEPMNYDQIAEKTGFARSTVRLYLTALAEVMPSRLQMFERSYHKGGRKTHFYWLT